MAAIAPQLQWHYAPKNAPLKRAAWCLPLANLEDLSETTASYTTADTGTLQQRTPGISTTWVVESLGFARMTAATSHRRVPPPHHHTHTRARARARARAHARTRTRARAHAHARSRTHARARTTSHAAPLVPHVRNQPIECNIVPSPRHHRRHVRLTAPVDAPTLGQLNKHQMTKVVQTLACHAGLRLPHRAGNSSLASYQQSNDIACRWRPRTCAQSTEAIPAAVENAQGLGILANLLQVRHLSRTHARARTRMHAHGWRRHAHTRAHTHAHAPPQRKMKRHREQGAHGAILAM